MESVYFVVGTLSMHIQLNVDPESITTKVIWSFEVSLEFEFLEVFSSFLSARKKSAWWCLSCVTVVEWRHVSSSLVAHCDVLSSNDKNVVVPLNINQPNYLSSLPSLFAGARLVLIIYIVAQSVHSCEALLIRNKDFLCLGRRWGGKETICCILGQRHFSHCSRWVFFRVWNHSFALHCFPPEDYW